jgi:hypothetical protein
MPQQKLGSLAGSDINQVQLRLSQEFFANSLSEPLSTPKPKPKRYPAPLPKPTPHPDLFETIELTQPTTKLPKSTHSHD